MPAKKRPRRERTDDWQKIQQYSLWPEQKVYELLRPVVLFNESATERARETGKELFSCPSLRYLYRKKLLEQMKQDKLLNNHPFCTLFPKNPTNKMNHQTNSGANLSNANLDEASLVKV
jgi:hypothetical protein